MQVVLAGLELANALVASDASVMETMCLVGIVPTIARFAAASWARGIRLQAALFVQKLCRTSLATAQMFVACQVQPPVSHCFLWQFVGIVTNGLLGACCLLVDNINMAIYHCCTMTNMSTDQMSHHSLLNPDSSLVH